MTPESKIYVAGHRGLVGSALVRRLRHHGYRNFVLRTRAEVELTDIGAVRRFFTAERPDVVLLAAAKVGGIVANNSYPADFIQDNLLIQTNVIHEAWSVGVKEFLFLGSSCIYPRECPQPIREDYLLTGPLEPTNRPYAVAKIAGLEMCWAYNRQHGTRYICAMPTNLYGPNDNYDLHTAHVLPALIRKFHQAKVRGDTAVTIWGTGKPRREFLYSDDMADACVVLLQKADELLDHKLRGDKPPLVNVGCGEDLTIAQLAEEVRTAVGCKARIVYDSTKPDGTPRKLLDISLLRSLGWAPQTDFARGLQLAYADFKELAVERV